MRVLVACEFSGIVRDAFTALGHDAWSCDILPSESDSEKHFQCDVRNVMLLGWDLMICHPPCTYLTVSQAWTFYHPDDKHLPVDRRRAHPKFPDRFWQRKTAVTFCQMLMNAPIERIALENPIGFLSTMYRKPDQIIQPWMFGHNESKSTCLWLKNLPLLKPTNVIRNDTKRYDNTTPSGQNKLSPSPDRWKLRSRTYTGIAQAMAEQ